MRKSRVTRGILLRIAGWMTGCACLLTFVTIGLPGILVNQTHGDKLAVSSELTKDLANVVEKPLSIPVYRTSGKTIESIPLEAYVKGVVAAEMPIDFEIEALKAQAIAARTYIINRVINRDFSNVPQAGAWVTDSVTHQAYLSDAELKAKWGFFKYVVNMEKINEAVRATKGTIITYQGKPIVAAFFSTSNGYTENSEDYWGEYIPYLRSVSSKWDMTISPKYSKTVSFDLSQFKRLFNVPSILPVSTGNAWMKVLATTEGHRIKQVRIGDKTFTGRQVREKLGLSSSQFTWKLENNKMVITTYGYGHGVGMSQWGANGMAQEGKDCVEIIKHYYQGVQVESWTNVLLSAERI